MIWLINYLVFLKFAKQDESNGGDNEQDTKNLSVTNLEEEEIYFDYFFFASTSDGTLHDSYPTFRSIFRDRVSKFEPEIYLKHKKHI